MAHSENEANRAEIVRLECGEDIVVEHCIDVIAHDCKKKHGVWVADWGGCFGVKGFGINGESKELVIMMMEIKVTRKKQAHELKVWCESRRARQEEPQ